MARKLASAQIITALRDVAGTEFLQVARVLGWNVIVSKKDNLSVGDLIVYVETDSLLPDRPEFEFFRAKHFKIKTMKMRGEFSQGLVLPISILHIDATGINVDDDLTELLGIIQFNAPKPPTIKCGRVVTKRVYKFQWIPQKVMHSLWSNMYWLYTLLTKSIGNSFPLFVPKTDETRVQLMQGTLDKYNKKCFVVTEKVDGQSITVYNMKGTYGVCSRNVDLDINDTTNDHVAIAHSLNIEPKLKKIQTNYALQGELVGPGIQGNKLELVERTVLFYNVFNIDTQRYLDHLDFKSFIESMGLQTVPILYEDFEMINDIDALLDMSCGKSVINPKVLREGLVFRPIKDTIDYTLSGFVAGRVSFKAVSREWLIKFKE